MGFVWITFATENNVDGDIDYLAQEISRSGPRTRLHPLFPGEDDKIDRLMPAFLGRPDQSDAWIVYGSAESLRGDRADKLRRIVEQAVAKRGDFPRIGLFTNAEALATGEQIPLTTRLFVDDPEWRSRLGSGPRYRSSERRLKWSRVATICSKAAAFGIRAVSLHFRVPSQDETLGSSPLRDIARGTVPRSSRRYRINPYEEGFSDDAEWYFLRGELPPHRRTHMLSQ